MGRVFTQAEEQKRIDGLITKTDNYINEPCIICRGTGTRSYEVPYVAFNIPFTEDGRFESWAKYTQSTQCWRCNGTGKVDITRSKPEIPKTFTITVQRLSEPQLASKRQLAEKRKVLIQKCSDLKEEIKDIKFTMKMLETQGKLPVRKQKELDREITEKMKNISEVEIQRMGLDLFVKREYKD